jgi:hypothetical protein
MPMALRNIGKMSPWRPWITVWGGCFHEDMIGAGGPQWTELRRREAERVSSVGNARSLESSTLWF